MTHFLDGSVKYLLDIIRAKSGPKRVRCQNCRRADTTGTCGYIILLCVRMLYIAAMEGGLCSVYRVNHIARRGVLCEFL